MSTVLPHGLINITQTELRHATSTNDIDLRFEHVRILQQFWRVHFVRRKVSRHSSDFRSENLFWRTWSSSHLRDTVNTDTLATLWNRCREDIDLSPFDLATRPLKNISRKLSSEHQQPDFANLNLREGLFYRDNNSLVSLQARSQNRHSHAQLREHQIREDTPNAISSGQVRPKPNRSTGSKYLSGRSKRPPVGRRKSNQSTPQHGKQPKSPGTATKSSQKEVVEGESAKSQTAISTFELPSASSWEDEPSNEGISEPDPVHLPSGSNELTIDPDFRNKFAEKIASASNLASMARIRKTGSVVRFADEPALELRRVREKEDLEAIADDHNDLNPLYKRRSSESIAISDTDDEEEEQVKEDNHSYQMRRTTSQLSFLISERRATQGQESSDLSATVLSLERQTKPGNKAEDEEILAMARRQGVTKEGGVQGPLQHRLGKDADSRYSSPERDVTF